MDFNETVRVRPQSNKGQRIYIFDSNSHPKEVNLTSLGKTEIAFGRDVSNDIVLSSRLASRQHGKLSYLDEQWRVTDLGSTNGIIYHNNEITESKVEKDDFIRIDNAVETVDNGILIIFATDEYSDTWESISAEEWGSEYSLNLISPKIDAAIEQSGNLFYLNVQNPNLYINKKAVSGRVILHEKDVIACNDIRMVFTSNALYINKLKVSVVMNSKPTTPEGFAINNSLEDISENNMTSKEDEEASSRFTQDVPPAVSEQEPYNSGVTDEPIQKNVQNVQYDNNSQNSYHTNSASSTESGGGFRNFLASNAGYYAISFVIAIIIWGIAVALWTSQGELALIVILAGAVFGWKALNSIQPAMFIWMSWAGWIIYFCVKFILSAVIGLFVAPFKIGKLIAGAISGSV